MRQSAAGQAALIADRQADPSARGAKRPKRETGASRHHSMIPLPYQTGPKGLFRVGVVVVPGEGLPAGTTT
ncbi:MAG: hypothetical protein RI556_11525 [Hydrogenovibrio sp.]|uniref:hypothetical protein n=1 Tax=Hydrogenovibrio sp. TaxID=2065821 RepID=UPI0028707376|nr:hypothetical protein [Hydrogenovibrio sp.]MDR9499797.1 hypothetical protein [Hydrogenovibrio sp.]